MTTAIAFPHKGNPSEASLSVAISSGLFFCLVWSGLATRVRFARVREKGENAVFVISGWNLLPFLVSFAAGDCYVKLGF